MDINTVVENAVIARMERILCQKYETQQLIDINKAMTQAIQETTNALLAVLAKKN